MSDKPDNGRKAVTVYLSAEQHAQATAAAGADERTLSAWIKRCVAESLSRRKE